jgi:two-component system, NarL family, invasion response regulator UvrY
MLFVLVVSDCYLIKFGLTHLLQDEYRPITIREASNGAEALSSVTSRAWDVIILDNSISDRPGLPVLGEILKRRPAQKVLVLSGQTDGAYGRHALRMGASSWLPRAASRAELVRAIRSLLSRNGRPKGSRSAGSEPRHTILSRREYKVMLALGAGKRPREIASDFKLSSKTISTYRRRLLNKMGFESSADIVRYLIENRLE